MGIFEDYEINEQTFGLTEAQLDEVYKKVKHAEIDAQDLIQLIKLVFPGSPEAQARAFFLHDLTTEWAEDEDEE